MTQRIDRITIIGLGVLLMPLLTMWHEIGGHAAMCAGLGGQVATIGAFYVECEQLAGARRVLVSCAGVLVNMLLSAVAYLLWRRARGDMARLVLWLVWISEGFVAAGYFCFSGASGVGDLAPGSSDGLGPVPYPIAWRVAEFVIGAAAYFGLLVPAAIRALSAMLGDARSTGPARKAIAHIYYAAAGVAAVLTGLLNPVGLFITIMSAAASSFGGLAGMISIGFATPSGAIERPFVIRRSWPILIGGVVVLVAFATILGPSLKL